MNKDDAFARNGNFPNKPYSSAISLYAHNFMEAFGLLFARRQTGSLEVMLVLDKHRFVTSL